MYCLIITIINKNSFLSLFFTMKILDIPKENRPRERFLKMGGCFPGGERGGRRESEG